MYDGEKVRMKVRGKNSLRVRGSSLADRSCGNILRHEERRMQYAALQPEERRFCLT